ncbi:activating transcription factor 7-interacting protein 1-like [Eucyclogobius newberryi]|uniref:activating transcription factor 7-interacting protein 1-like n=1 Tax=Eucyclogobius newberryi TaxID=166745 RepID=UPI003B5B7080
MEKTKKQFEHLHAENAALKAAFDDIRERTTPSPTTSVVRQPKGVFEGLAKLLHIKKEPVDDQEAQYSQVAASGSAKRTKEEPHSPEENRNPKRIKFEPEEVPYPPLPELPFPSMLSLEAVNYNVPPRLKVDLALIKNPSPQLSVVWTLDEDDSNAPPMDSYSIYHTTELATGSSMFDEWQKIRDVEAMALPMFYPHIKYRPGYKICVSVVGKDKFGRYGPFSKVACAFL